VEQLLFGQPLVQLTQLMMRLMQPMTQLMRQMKLQEPPLPAPAGG
jgi:hypothetical protein